MADTPNDVFRDYVTPGVPSSGDYEPEKPRIRRMLNSIISSLAAFSPLAFAFDAATTDADPGAGYFRLNHADPESATAAYFDNVNEAGVTVSAILDTWDNSTSTVKGQLLLTKSADPSVFHAYAVSGSVVDGTGYRKLTLAHVAGAGDFAADDVVIAQFLPAGDAGAGSAEVDTRTEMKALDEVSYPTAYLMEAGREGKFEWNGADLSSLILGPSKTTNAVDSDAETLSFASNHWWTTGQSLVVTSAVNGLSTNTLYYAIRVDDDTIKLASSYANALAGTAVDLTGTSATTLRQHMDPTEGIYVCPSADITGASGAWERVVRGPGLNIMWFGATRGADSTQFINNAAEFQNKAFWSGSAIAANDTYVFYPDGKFLVNPTVGIRLRDYAKHVGSGVAATMLEAANTSAGNFFYRQYSGGTANHERVAHVEISGIRGIVTGASQIVFNLEHIGRCEVHHVLGTTQDRDDEYNNANQKYWPGSALFKIAVGDSAPNGYVNGSDVMELHHFRATFLDYGVQSAAAANQKAPEALKIRNFEISDCHQPIVLNAGAAMLPYFGLGEIQRWGNETTRADTSTAGADNYGLDYVANKACIEHIYFEGNSAFAAILTRSGTANVVKTARLNRYGTTTTLHSDSGTSTVTSD